jgi:hypothetical protein
MRRLSKEKEFSELISSVRICKENNLKIKLNIAGYGTEGKNLVLLIKN